MQKQVASELGVHTKTYCYWEQGRGSPRVDHWGRIVEFLGYHPGDRPQTFSERVVRLRETLGISQRRLAELLGADSSTVLRWEKGHEPKAEYRKRLEDMFKESGLWSVDVEKSPRKLMRHEKEIDPADVPEDFLGESWKSRRVGPSI